MAVKELNISPVGRVEGDLDVKVYIDNGKVTRAHTQAAMFRGFVKIMAGKEPQSGLIVTPRICGICGGSHLYCASSALDTAWGTKLPPNALLLRAIGQATETIQSIPRWFYAIFATDLANKKYADKPLYKEVVERWSAYVGTIDLGAFTQCLRVPVALRCWTSRSASRCTRSRRTSSSPGSPRSPSRARCCAKGDVVRRRIPRQILKGGKMTVWKCGFTD